MGKQPNFSAEAHFESKIKNGSIKNQSPVIKFNNTVFEPKKITTEKGFRRICKDQFDFASFEAINELHSEYLRKMTGFSRSSSLSTKTSPSLNTTAGPSLNTTAGPSLNTKTSLSLNTTAGPSLNSPSLNTKTSLSLNTLYKAELTGAKIKIDSKIGFVVEERKNVLVVIFDQNILKIYPKKAWNFSLLLDNEEYLFISENLKKNRFLK